MKRRKRSVIVTIVFAMMGFMIAMGALRALPAKAGEAEEETLEFDLRDGYLRRTDSSGFIMQTILNSYRCSREDSLLYDLDGDGTADVRISIWNKVFYNAHEVLTPVPGGSILGDYVLKATPERPLEYMTYENGPAVTHTVSSVVFHFPEEPVKAEYSLSGMGVAYFRDFTRDGERITKAAPGEIIYLLEDKKTGQYLKEWKTDSYPKDDLFYMHSNYYEDGTEADVAIAVRQFIMPAHDVTMTPVYEKQQPYTIQVDGPNVIMAGDTELIADGIDCFIASLFNWDTSNIDTYTWYNMYTYYDLDGDGTDDICLGPYKSAHSLSICLFSDLTSYTLTAPNDGPYWPVTLTWKENNYTVDPSYIYYGSFSPRTGQKLYRSLKSYEVNGKTGFFDLDQDGSEDLFFEGIHFEYLSTCSIENSITIPGVPEGINHPVTFVVKGISGKKFFHRVIVIKENEGDYYFNNSDWPRISDWFEEGTGVCLSPGEGYEFNSISINGSKVYLDDYARAFQYEFEVINHDMVVRIQFRTKEGIVPKPVHTAQAYVIDLSKSVFTIPDTDKAIIKPLMELVSEYGITQQDYTIRLSDTADPDSIPEYIMLPEIVEVRKQSYDMVQLLLPSSARTHMVSVEGGTIEGSSMVVEGETVYIIPDKRDDGYWVRTWKFENPDTGFNTDVMSYTYQNGILEFEMGANDVLVRGDTWITKPLTINLSSGKCEYTGDIITCIRDALGFGPRDNTVSFDLDGDGTRDIMMNSITMELWASESYSCGESYTLEGATRGPYYPITFVYNPKNVEPDVTVTPEPTAELTEPTGEPADSSEKKEDSSFHPIYFIIPACVLVCGGATAFLLMRRKKRAAKGEEER